MEADMMKLSPEDHMEVLTLLMQMEKFPPELYGDNTYNSTALLYPDNLEASTFPHHPNNPSFFLENPNSDPTLHSSMVSDRFYRNGAPSPPHCSALAAEIFSNNGKRNSMAEMREMIFRIAAMQPIHIDPESVKPPKRRNVRISKDPQSVAARHRREKISERIRILQRLVPGGTKMDTASMLDEAIHYVKFLKKQVQTLEQAAITNSKQVIGFGFPSAGVGHAPSRNCL